MEDHEMMDYGIEEYDKEPYYRDRNGGYRIVYGKRNRAVRIARGIGPFLKLVAGITVFLVLVGMIS